MKPDYKETKQNANALLGTGTSLAAFSAGTALTIGVTCPLCLVAAPVLIGAGIIGRIRSAKQRNEQANDDANAVGEGAKVNG